MTDDPSTTRTIENMRAVYGHAVKAEQAANGGAGEKVLVIATNAREAIGKVLAAAMCDHLGV